MKIITLFLTAQSSLIVAYIHHLITANFNLFDHRIGCPQFTFPSYKPSPTSGASHSLFFPQEAINSHPRFRSVKNLFFCLFASKYETTMIGIRNDQISSHFDNCRLSAR